MFLKSHLPNVQIVLSDPQGSGLYNKIKHGVLYSNSEQEGTRKRHQVDTIVEGIGLNRLTRNFAHAVDKRVIDDAISVTDEECLEMSRFIMENEGIQLASGSYKVCSWEVHLQ